MNDECYDCGTNQCECAAVNAARLQGLIEEIELWRKSCNHAKRQRDRAIAMVNTLLLESGVEPGWHPDNEGPYPI